MSAIEVLKKHIESIREYAEYPNKQLINSLDEAIVALEKKEKLKQEVTYQLDQLIYTDKTKENIRRSVWKEVLELMK